MKLTRRMTLLAGFALIILTNAIALGGVSWNRSGEPDSRLLLSERELSLPHYWVNRENSGMAFALQWRIAPPRAEDAPSWFRAGGGGGPEWLDQAKMESLGFTFRPALDYDPYRWRRHQSQSWEALLVLELDGPDYQHSLAQVRRQTESELALLAANPDTKEFIRRADNARERLREEEQEASRLFVVDAGLDHGTLRTAYPDRARYAIVRGQITPWQNDAYPGGPRGFIRRVQSEAINLPFVYRRLFEADGSELQHRSDTNPIRFSAEVSFGKRLEPWVVSISRDDR